MALHVGGQLMMSQPVLESSGSHHTRNSNKLLDSGYHSGGYHGSYHNDGYHFDSYRSDAYHSGSRSDNRYSTTADEAGTPSSQRRTDLFNSDFQNLSPTRDGDALAGDV